MRIFISIAVAALPLVAAAQEPKKDDPSKLSMEVTGCVRGSMLTETNVRVEGANEPGPARRWRLRGAKALMRQIKEHEGKELEITGTTKSRDAVTPGKRIGRTNIFIGGDSSRTARDPLPEQPTIDVESFEPTGAACPG